MYERYAELRDLKGVTDYQVAKETGVNPAILYSWKAGRWNPSAGTVIKLAQYFEVPMERFYEKN